VNRALWRKGPERLLCMTNARAIRRELAATNVPVVQREELARGVVSVGFGRTVKSVAAAHPALLAPKSRSSAFISPRPPTVTIVSHRHEPDTAA
jgi:hypothetical protein